MIDTYEQAETVLELFRVRKVCKVRISLVRGHGILALGNPHF